MTGFPRLCDLTSVYDAFAQTAARCSDRPMLNVQPSTAEIYGIAAGEITYAAAAAEVEALSARFAGAGYGAGMRVALLLENRPSYFLIWLALNRLGVSVVPINPDLRAAELEYLIGHAEPALILALPARAEGLRAAAEAAGIAAPVVAPGDTPPPPRHDAAIAGPETGQAAEAALLYTSGTTGQPKGCVLSNTYFLYAGDWYAELGGIGTLEDGARMITPLPVFHMNAMACSFMAMIAVGGCLTVLDRFHPKSWWADVRGSNATCLHYLGVMPSMLMGAAETPADRDHQVRFGFGAGVDPKLQAGFEARFGLELVEAWAMTETGAGAAISAHTKDRLVGAACFGRPAPEVETRLVDAAGQDADRGELLVRRAGPDPRFGFFTRYFKNPEATDEAWAGGWFHTGDIVRCDADGNLFFIDRKKNVIRRSGENIAAVEVESVLMRHPAIRAAGVAPVPDAIRGDEVFACVVAEGLTASELTAEALADWALTQMAYYKIPGYIAFVEALPLTATQKIQRAALKALAAECLAQNRAVDLRARKRRQVA
ncbi:MAG: AMP-binding protein [Pseudomonadota bacterium]